MGKERPAMVWPLADFLAEEMEEREWTCVDVAKRMPGDYAINIGVINFILVLDEDFRLGEGVAAALAQVFGVSEQFIDGLHEIWMRNPEARQPFECPEHLLDGLVFPDAADRGGAHG